MDYTEKLIKALKHPRALKRREAAWLLGLKKDIIAVEPLIEVLNSNDDPYVLANAAESLGKIGNSNAIYALIKSLESSYVLVRGKSAWALGEIGEDSAMDALNKALKDNNKYVRDMAKEALSKINLKP